MCSASRCGRSTFRCPTARCCRPTGFVGLKPYFDLWSNARWKIAYGNLFYFSAFYVVLSLAVGLALAIAIDQRVRGEAIWRTIFLYPLAVSFVVTGVGVELAL